MPAGHRHLSGIEQKLCCSPKRSLAFRYRLTSPAHMAPARLPAAMPGGGRCRRDVPLLASGLLQLSAPAAAIAARRRGHPTRRRRTPHACPPPGVASLQDNTSGLDNAQHWLLPWQAVATRRTCCDMFTNDDRRHSHHGEPAGRQARSDPAMFQHLAVLVQSECRAAAARHYTLELALLRRACRESGCACHHDAAANSCAPSSWRCSGGDCGVAASVTRARLVAGSAGLRPPACHTSEQNAPGGAAGSCAAASAAAASGASSPSTTCRCVVDV